MRARAWAGYSKCSGKDQPCGLPGQTEAMRNRYACTHALNLSLTRTTRDGRRRGGASGLAVQHGMRVSTRVLTEGASCSSVARPRDRYLLPGGGSWGFAASFSSSVQRCRRKPRVLGGRCTYLPPTRSGSCGIRPFHPCSAPRPHRSRWPALAHKFPSCIQIRRQPGPGAPAPVD